jgi:hypothetical protein
LIPESRCDSAIATDKASKATAIVRFKLDYLSGAETIATLGEAFTNPAVTRSSVHASVDPPGSLAAGFENRN